MDAAAFVPGSSVDMSYTTHAAGARNGHGNNAADQFQPQRATHGMMSADYSVVLQGRHAEIKVSSIRQFACTAAGSVLCM